ncbi:MAG: hypothetical protein LBV69_08315 [Bacteroidales bacterium]|jgi:hypothetical protein|nr:hypothetical protein [Bacteroidales bacterium]
MKNMIINLIKNKKRLIIIFFIFYLFVLPAKSQNYSYTNDNLIYEIGNKWVYEYEYQPHNNKNTEKVILMKKEIQEQRIDKIVMKVIKFDWNSVVKFNLNDRDEYDVYKDRTMQNNYPPLLLQDGGMIIENNERVWIHPPRTFFFKILEINSFPYILKPYITGREWDWSLKIGQQWGNNKWKEWEGNITNKSHYKISGDTILDTKIGKLHCYIVDSYAVSELGKTYLTSYFNQKYGFVKLDYTNIDDSKIILNLIKITTEAEKLISF